MMLKPGVAAVDKPGMSEHDLLSDSLDEQNLLVLQSYADRSQAAAAARDDHDGWLDRLEMMEYGDPEELTRIHGTLIALGMLKFKLASRETGLQYCISQRGQCAIEHLTGMTTTAAVPAP